MKRKMKGMYNDSLSNKIGLLLTICCLLPLSALVANQIGIFVDGGYTDGDRNSEMDSLIIRRLDEGMRIMKERFPDSRRKNAGRVYTISLCHFFLKKVTSR